MLRIVLLIVTISPFSNNTDMKRKSFLDLACRQGFVARSSERRAQESANMARSAAKVDLAGSGFVSRV